MITQEQESALLLLAAALDACKTAQIVLAVPGRSYLHLEIGCSILECLDLSANDELSSAGIHKSLSWLGGNKKPAV